MPRHRGAPPLAAGDRRAGGIMTISARQHTRGAGGVDRRVRTIQVVAETSASASRVLEAAYDFSERRAAVFPAVSVPHLEVHELGSTSADVTEGTPVGRGVNWERCRYDWSQPGVVTATVTDSNVYAVPGSSWEVTAAPSGTGSRVEMTWVRGFRDDPRG